MRKIKAFALSCWFLGVSPLFATCPEGWAVQSWQPPRLLWVGKPAQVPVELVNRSQEVWSEARGDHLSYHWRLTDGQVVAWDGDRTQLPSQVYPGESLRLFLRVRPPQKPGRYLLEVAMVREQVCWYKAPGSGPVMATVRVWPREPFYAGGFFLGTLGLVALARWRRPLALVGLGPCLWLLAALWLVGKLFALLANCEGGGSFDWFLLSGACALAWPWPFLPQRGRRWVVPLLGLGFTFFAFADTLYLRFFGSIIPVSAWRGAGQVGQVWESVRSLLLPADAWFALVALACLAMALWPGPREEGRPALGRWLSLGLGVVVLAGGLPTLAKVWQLTGGNLGAQVFSLQHRAQELGLWGAHFLDWGRTWRLQRQKLGEKDKERVRGFFLQRAEKLQALPAPFFGAAKGANLLLIQVESLQQFVVGLQVQGQEVTPFLNRLAKEGLYFPWVFDQTNQGRSADGEFIALNSQHALGEGAAVFRAASNRFLALPEVLRREGYHTLSAHPFERGFWNRALLHPRYGFSQSFFKRELGPGEIIGWGLADGAFFAKMVPILQRTPQPFFAFLITLGLHHPFDQFPEARKMLKLPDLGDPALENYLQAMRYFDASLQAFLQELSAKGILAHTVVALYGDHEAGIPLQEPLARLLQITWSPGRLVWLRRVPFFVLPPVAGLSGEVPEVGGQVDIAPTLLYLLGVPRPKAFVGVPLVPGWRGFAALADGSAVSSQLLWHEPTSRCQDRNTLAPLPEEACRSLRQAAAQELWASRMVVLHNLLPELLP